jgi:hypothetical protein
MAVKILLKLVDDNYEILSVILLLSVLLQLTFFMYSAFLDAYRDLGLSYFSASE